MQFIDRNKSFSMYNLLTVINQNQKKILLFGSNSGICKDLVPKLLSHKEYKNLEIHCFHRKKKTLRVIQNERLFYHFLDYKTNLNTTHFKNLFSNWRLAIFFYGDFGPIDQFKNINHSVWEKSFISNFFAVTRVIKCLLNVKNYSKNKSIITFSGSGTNGVADNYSAYTIAKIALIKFSELIDSENKSIKITTIGPGWYKSKLHNKTIKAKHKSGKNYSKTKKALIKTNNHNISQIIFKFILWFDKSKKKLVGGRNFSLIHDKFLNRSVLKKLQNIDNYKLRRRGN